VEDLNERGVLGIFGSPLPMSDHLEAALRAAEDLSRDLANISARRKREDLPPFDLRVWIHTGEAALGLVGVPDRGEYRAMGKPVDTILSLESPEGLESTGAVVTEAVVSAADLADKTRPVGSCSLPTGQINLFQMQ